MKLALGTVQFGLDYGISNTQGQISLPEAQSILNLAHKSNIDLLDTAAGYGTSESVLGELNAAQKFKFVTKTSAEKLPTFEKNLKKLKASSVYGLMIHSADELLGPNGDNTFRNLSSVKENHQASKIGVSVYDPEQALEILKRFPIEIIQIPLSPLDQRFINSGTIDRLKDAGVEVHVRSIFLQGLLLMAQNSIPKKMSYAGAYLERFQQRVQGMGLSALEFCLGFANGVSGVDKVVVGVNAATQLSEILVAASKVVSSEHWSDLACDDTKVTKPMYWPKD